MNINLKGFIETFRYISGMDIRLQADMKVLPRRLLIEMNQKVNIRVILCYPSIDRVKQQVDLFTDLSI